MPYWYPDYICILDAGAAKYHRCEQANGIHSLACKAKNKEYAEAARTREQKRRLAHMDAVIRGEVSDE